MLCPPIVAAKPQVDILTRAQHNFWQEKSPAANRAFGLVIRSWFPPFRIVSCRCRQTRRPYYIGALLGLQGTCMPVTIGGNRCGHNKCAPTLTPPDYQIPKNLPAILRDAIHKAETFYTSPDLLVEVWKGRKTPIQPHHKQKRLFTSRMMRSERREAICRVLVLLIAMTDLRSLNVGHVNYKTGHFMIPDLAWFAEKTQLSNARVLRAMTDLRRAGLIKVQERATATKGEAGYTRFRARTALRTLSERVFTMLGISRHRLNRERASAKQRHLEKLKHAQTHNWLGNVFKTLSTNKSRKRLLEGADGRPLWRPKSREDFIQINRLALALQKSSPPSPFTDVEKFKQAQYQALQISMGIK